MAESLVIAKKDRAVIRSAIDKYIERINDLLKSQDPDIFELEELLEQLCEASDEVKKIDLDVKKLTKENQIDAELQSAEEYREKIITWRFKAKRKVKELNKKQEHPHDLIKQDSEHRKETMSVKLPKLEIAKFSGNTSEWLTFWSSFVCAIHENKTLDTVDKFNYLKTYLTGPALKCIEGFSITGENYDKCIDLLRDRFGRKDLLINVHMNKLLNIAHVKSSNDVRSLRNLYDRIQTQIRSLESLNINLSSYGNLLSPIILKLLPRELILEFHKVNVNEMYSVQDILNFLSVQINAREKLEPENQTQFSSYQSKRNSGGNHFAIENATLPKLTSSNQTYSRPSSAAHLFVNSKVQKQKKQKCSFCESEVHVSNECTEIKNMSFDEKLNILRRKGICFRCLQISKHIARNCNSKIFCSFCNGKHSDIMCNQRNQIKEKEQFENADNSKQMLSNRNKLSNVYLQTLIAEIRGNNRSALARIVIDSGSENSYVSKYLANKLNLSKIKTENIRHGLFGGIELSEEHSVYKFTVTSLDKSFNYQIHALDQNKICTGIKCVSDKKLIETLENENVFLSDVYDKRNLCLFENSPEEIHLLLGANIAAHLFTPNLKYLPKLGLSAFQTKLGWVIMGKAKDNSMHISANNSTSTLSLSLHVSNCNLTDMWRLDTLGITSEENRTKLDLEEETQNYFLKTVKRDVSGRFEVSLPWVVEQSLLPSNRAIAENAVYKTEKKLIASKKKNEYSEIFDSWEFNKIIERVTDKKKDNIHFLLH